MTTLIEFRADNPAYNEVPDKVLADALHAKFYSQIPKENFYKMIELSPTVQIPGLESSINVPKTQPSMQDRVMGAVETPAILAGALGSAIASPIAGLVSRTFNGFNTPEGKAAGQKMQAQTAAQFYQPRTESGSEYANTIASGLGVLPPTLVGAGNAMNVLSGPAVNQLRPLMGKALAPAQNAMVNFANRNEPVMTGMGAANTGEDLLRAERAQRQNIRLTKGQQTQDLGQLQFESDTAKEYPSGVGKPLLANTAAQKSDILKRMDRMAEETGAQGALSDPEGYRNLGKIVDKELVTAYEAKLDKVNKAYQKARASNETKALVNTKPLDDWLTNHAAEAISIPEINSIEAKLKAFKDLKGGQVNIDDLELLYQTAGKLGKPGETSGKFMKDVKTVIDQMTDGAGGSLYQQARTERRALAKEFDDNIRVAKLLGTQGKFADRTVAYEDVFKHIVLDGSKEEMQKVAILLKKAGPEGRQAFSELQGQTIQYLKDQMTKNANGELSYAKLKTSIDSLDREGKLSYMFGNKGRDQIIDFRDSVKDALVNPPGAVNYSGSGSRMVRFFDALEKTNFPGSSFLADSARTREMAKRVEDSIKFNALAPDVKSTNKLRP